MPRPVHRSSLYQVINTDYHLDGTWYDSLEDSSCGHENNTKYYYNGRHYRSRSEMDIAVVLDEFGLEFKYDVKVKFNGMIFTVDFVIYFREFNRCVILEYYGRCAVPSYNEKNITKIRNSLIDGIYIGRDMFILSGDAEYTPSIPVIRAYVSSIIEMVCHYHIRS